MLCTSMQEMALNQVIVLNGLIVLVDQSLLIFSKCKLILKILKPETILKVKENKVVHQSDSTSNCGWFCCKFLIDRFRGKSFADATGYDDRVKISHIKHDEAEIERLKKM